MLTCMLAHLFILAPENQVGEKKAPSLTLSQLKILLNVLLPFRIFGLAESIDLARWIQRKNHKAYLSHQKRKLMRQNDK